MKNFFYSLLLVIFSVQTHEFDFSELVKDQSESVVNIQSISKVKFSKMHCNFIENSGSSGQDVEDLINHTIDEVKNKFNIILEPEIKIIGDK